MKLPRIPFHTDIQVKKITDQTATPKIDLPYLRDDAKSLIRNKIAENWDTILK